MEKLYYQDAYIQSFTAHVQKQQQDEAGRLFVVLEETAFYPTGGGQPCDTGRIGSAEVIAVEEVNGEIRHYLSSPITETEAPAQLDWPRRFDHMQQHAGQHILSAAFSDLLHIPTISFHLGKDTVTIDLKTEKLTQEHVQQAETLANEIVFQNRPITATWMSIEEAAALPLRKQPSVTEGIRVVIIEDFDYNGCGGTHPKRTGEVGPIQVLGWERHKGHVRLEFACGWRVLRFFRDKHAVLKETGRLLNSAENEVALKVQQLLHTQKESDKALQEAKDRLLAGEAKELLATIEIQNGTPCLAAAFTHRSMQELAKLAALVAGQMPEIVVLLATKQEQLLQCVCMRGSNAARNMNDLLKQGLHTIGGKGGGNAQSARGGGQTETSPEDFLRSLLSFL